MKLVTTMREVPNEDREVTVSELIEEGDTVTFHMSVKTPHPETGEVVAVDSDSTWRFNAAGQVTDVWPSEVDQAEAAFRALGVDTD